MRDGRKQSWRLPRITMSDPCERQRRLSQLHVWKRFGIKHGIREATHNSRENYAKVMPFFFACSIFQRPFPPPLSRSFHQRSLLHPRESLYRSWDSPSNFSPSKYRCGRHLRREKGERWISVDTPITARIEFLSRCTFVIFAKTLSKMENRAISFWDKLRRA